MGILPPKNNKEKPLKKQKLSLEERAEAFEKWMINEGYWSRVDGQLYMSGSHISMSDAQTKFNAFISKPI